MDTLTLPVDAVTDLPDELIAAVVTFLEMRAPPASRSARGAGGDLAFERLRGADAARYLALYRAVGERWLWFSRLTIAPSALAAILDDPRVEALAVVRSGVDIGLVELDARPERETELAFFGVVVAAIGQGVGRRMMEEAVARAFSRAIDRLFVHTCTLDHPGAVGFYQRSGFRAYKRAVEVARDPRLTGALERDAGSHFPLLTISAKGAGEHSQSVVEGRIFSA